MENQFQQLAVDQVFFKFQPLDEYRVKISLWDFRHPRPLEIGMIMNLGNEDFDAHSIEYALTALLVNMANYVANLARNN